MPLVMGVGILPSNVPTAPQPSRRGHGQTTLAYESGMA
jgi:hypothetical protein